MHAFDILAESKIREWQQTVREKKENPSEETPHSTAPLTESYEKILYYDIRKTIIESFMTQGEEREALLKSASDMQVQLASRLEKSGYNIISKMFGDEIQALRQRAHAVSHDRAQLLSMLNTLD